MQVVASALLHPGSCSLCHTAAGPFVDTGRVNVGGRVYVCRQCVRDTHATINETYREPVTVDETAALKDELEALRNRHRHLVQAVHLTLTEGVAIRRGKVALRSQRGQPGFDLELG